MDQEIEEKYIKAGRIASQALKFGAKEIKPGVSYLKVAEDVEGFIKSKGARLAFPTNIAVNEIAAHYAPDHDDRSTFEKGDLVKLDTGAHVDGYIADTALTVEAGSNNHHALAQAPVDALMAVEEVIGDGIPIDVLGSTIEGVIHNAGCIPIENLTGHSLSEYELHSGLTVPNVGNSASGKLRAGDAVAIEPFATLVKGNQKRAKGYSSVNDVPHSGSIYRYLSPRKPKSKQGKELRELIKKKFGSLPLCERWLWNAVEDGGYKYLNTENLGEAIDELIKRRIIYLYRVLMEKRGKLVSQREHTFLIRKGDVVVTTK